MSDPNFAALDDPENGPIVNSLLQAMQKAMPDTDKMGKMALLAATDCFQKLIPLATQAMKCLAIAEIMSEQNNAQHTPEEDCEALRAFITPFMHRAENIAVVLGVKREIQ